MYFQRFMVEAAGVEPEFGIENTQLTDSQDARNAQNEMISKSTVRTLYKHLPRIPRTPTLRAANRKKEHSEVLSIFIH